MPSEVPGFQHLIQHKPTILLIRRNNKARGRHAEHHLHDIHDTPANFHTPNSFNSFCTTSKAVEAEEVTAVVEPAELSPSIERRSHPAQSGETFDGPPTLERSGSEHRRAVTSLALLERARAWEWVKDPPAGEGQVGQKLLLCQRRARVIQKCIPSNHPITYQRYEKCNRHTARSIRNIPHNNRSNRSTHYRHDKQ